MGVLAEVDLVAVETLAKATARRIEYEKQLEEEGATILNPESGLVKVNPIYRLIREERDFEHRVLREFGATPSSRTRVHAQPEAARQRGDGILD
jgi:P27 family predicted phage terminase small subunit